MQVILGSGGAIGNDLAKELKKYTDRIRLASRNPKRINDDDELVKCDLTILNDVEKAVKGCDTAYLTVGLPYKTKTWLEQWPVIMKNTIAACKKHKTKLVFFDNIYMYHPDQLSPMTEETEISPVSKKGKVRAEIAQMVLNEIKTGKLEALIARAADFYGPGISNSVFNQVVISNLKAGKKANWFCSLDYLHNFTFTPDAAKATALLGNTESAYNQVWHLPTAAPVKGKEWIEKAAHKLGAEPKTQVASKRIVQFMGIFNPIMKEFVEMLYQWDRDYNFDSSKFETVFKIKPTPADEAINQIIQAG
ncbi:MAG: NAD-dependent epimerase/dehydratase family protein [Bacteroidetes bacterium]|nr:MAG: NAD-dependent epimerase/dehydratase family protein [Bacteroidota bacterium]